MQHIIAFFFLCKKIFVKKLHKMQQIISVKIM